jgi:general secretion pathway protein A
MYLDYWNLTRRPFDQRVNPRWFFASPHHHGSLAYVRGFVERRAPLAVLAGGPGVGKTMIAQVLAEKLAAGPYSVIRLPAVPVSVCDLLQRTIYALESRELPATLYVQRRYAERRMPTDERALTTRLREHLAARRAAGHHTVWILESAESYGDGELRHVATMARSFSHDSAVAVTILLVARSSLIARFSGIVALGPDPVPVCVLESMTAPETAAYVSHRLRLAGANPAIFSSDAIEVVHELSGGVARRVNRLCDLSLLCAQGDDALQVQPAHVRAADSEHRVLCLTRTATEPRTPAQRRLAEAAKQH